MITYYNLGKKQKINQIVIAGSHDAGISGDGHGYDITQTLNILEQAEAGVRIFDLRITGVSRKTETTNGKKVKVADLKTYHGAASKTKDRSRVIPALGHQAHNITTQKMRVLGAAGYFGLSLQDILDQAKQFVTDNDTEFLILKFDKSQNWLQIAQMCIRRLGDTIYKTGKNGGGFNLNECTLEQLKGSVIITFTTEGVGAVAVEYGHPDGIFGIKSLSKTKQPYDLGYAGLQYYGSGGTGVTTRNGTAGQRVVQENITNQEELMMAGIQSGSEVIGMMYWTITGALGSIQARNEYLWTLSNARKLILLWVKIKLKGKVGGFFPNIVMIDFVKPERCELIYRLNGVLGYKLGGYPALYVQQVLNLLNK